MDRHIPRGGRLQMVAALAVGLALRAFFVAHHPRFVGDTLVYGDLAQNLLHHHVYGLTEERIRPTLIRLPGYPLFLAMCFLLFGDGNYLAAVWVQVGVDLLGCVLLGEVARRMSGRRLGWAVLWLGALCPFTANYAAAALTETLSIFCVTLALWGLASWHGRVASDQPSLGFAVVVGVALMGAAVLRPDGGLLAAAVVPAMLWAAWRGRGQGWRLAGIGVGVRDAGIASGLLCAALAMWAGRNWEEFGVVQPLAPKYANDPGEATPLGFARWYRTWGVGFGDTVRVYWTYDGSEERLSDLPPWAFDNAAQRQRTAALYERYNEGTSSTPAIEAEFAALAAERVRRHPLRYYAGLPVARVADMWLRPRTELMKLPLDWLLWRAHPRRSWFAIGYAGLNLGLLLLAGVGWARWRRFPRSYRSYGRIVAFAGVFFVLLRLAMLLTIDNSEPRYTLECFPVVLLFAGVALVGSSGGAAKARMAEPLTDRRQ